MRRTSSSDSGVTIASTSSPASKTESPRGITTCSSRTMATMVALRGTSTSRSARSMTGRVVGEGHLDQAGLTALELEDAHQAADGDRLLDQRGDEVRGRHREVDAPVLVEQPLVLRVVHPGDHARHRELLLGEQRDDEVVLVVAGRGDDHVAARRARRRAAS